MTEAAPAAVAVRVRYFAGARAAAGIDEETVHVAGNSDEVDVGAVIEALLDRHGGRLAGVVPACSFLLDGVVVRDRSVRVPTDATLDVLPPFAGG